MGMNTAPGTRVKIKDTDNADKRLRELGVTVDLRGRFGNIVNGIISGSPEQVEVKFEGMDPRHDSWYIPLDPSVWMEVNAAGEEVVTAPPVEVPPLVDPPPVTP